MLGPRCPGHPIRGDRAGSGTEVNIWRLAFIALVTALVSAVLGIAVGAGGMVVLAPRLAPPPEEPPPVEHVVALSILPIKPPRRPRVIATLKRFGKVFAFVVLGLIAGALAIPGGMQNLLDPLNIITVLVASTIGAVFKFFTWTDVSGELPPSVTLALPSPATKAETPVAAPGGAE